MTAACLLAGCFFLFRGLPSLPEPNKPPAAATLAALQDESPYVTANIEDLRVGDRVLALNPETGELEHRRIVDAFSRTAYEVSVLTIRGPDGKEESLRTTDEHPFWVVEADDFLPAGELEVGDELLGPEGELTTLVATESEAHPEGVTVYNFEVEGAHTYFVTTASLPSLQGTPVLVHNAAGGKCGILRGSKKPANAKSKYGSYTIKFKSGMKYHGKGSWSRALASARRLAKKHKTSYDRNKDIDWKPAANDRQAFIDEALRIRGDAKGVRDPRNYNINNSPGEKWLPKPSG